MIDATSERWHPLHNLISWPAIIAGAVVAVAVGAMLNLLGIALGAASFNPYDLDGGDASGFTAAAGMWMAVANAVALFVGGAVASRAAKYSDHHKGGLNGLGTWGLAFLLALIIASASAAGGAAAIAGGEAADSGESAIVVDPATGARSRVVEGDLVAVDPRPIVEEAADATAQLALWGFLTMLIGAVAAVVGGMYGARHHRWMAKAGLGEHEAEPVTSHPAAEPSQPHRVYPTPKS